VISGNQDPEQLPQRLVILAMSPACRHDSWYGFLRKSPKGRIRNRERRGPYAAYPSQRGAISHESDGEGDESGRDGLGGTAHVVVVIL